MSSKPSENHPRPPETAPLPDVPPLPPRHFSETIHMEQWLRLLVMVSTCLVLLLAVAVGVKLLSSIGHTLLIFSLGGLLAYALDPLVEKIRPHLSGKSARLKSVFLVFGALLFVVVLGIVLLGKELVIQINHVAENHALYEVRARGHLADLDTWFHAHGVKIDLEDGMKNPPPNVKTWSEAVAKGVLRTFAMAAKDLVEGVIVLLVALYFLIYSEEMRIGVNGVLPPRLHPYVVQWQDDVNRILGGFVRGQLILALTIGSLAAVGCLLLGIKIWLVIGLFVVVAALIPVIGPFLGAIPAVIAAALTPAGMFNPVVRVVLVIIAFVFINEVGSKILYPKLVGAALGLHEVLMLFILFAGYEVSGLTGVLFAAPLTALSVVTLIQLYQLWTGLPPLSVAQAAQREGQRRKAEGTP